MRVAVMGSGGVGGYYGGKLAAAGEEVTFIARGAHLAAIRRDGLQVKSVAGDFHVRPKATDDPATVGQVDLVLFSVKGYDTETAAERCRPLVGPETVVLCVQNGVDNEEKLARILGASRVLGGVVHVLSTISAPGVITQTAGPRSLKCGEMDGGVSSRVTRVVDAFVRAGVAAEASPNILVDLWEKFVFICAHGGVTALGRMGIGDILGCPETARFYRGVMDEIAAVGRAKGVPLPADTAERAIAFASKLQPEMRSSLAHDLERGNRLEVDALMGAVVRYGAEVGVPTPLNAAIYACLLPHHRRALAAREALQR
jgi:2-dehydropantoate 2-reductase